MSNNPFHDSINIRQLSALIYSESARVGRLLEKSLQSVGCLEIHLATDVSTAIACIDEREPKVVIIVSDIHSAEKLSMAQKINKKRAPTKKRTPKILALMSPGVDDIMKAKGEGFYDVLPLPVTPAVLLSRLETVMTRLD